MYKDLTESPRNQYSTEGMSTEHYSPMYDTLFSGIYGGKKDNSYSENLGIVKDLHIIKLHKKTSYQVNNIYE